MLLAELRKETKQVSKTRNHKTRGNYSQGINVSEADWEEIFSPKREKLNAEKSRYKRKQKGYDGK